MEALQPQAWIHSQNALASTARRLPLNSVYVFLSIHYSTDPCIVAQTIEWDITG